MLHELSGESQQSYETYITIIGPPPKPVDSDKLDAVGTQTT